MDCPSGQFCLNNLCQSPVGIDAPDDGPRDAAVCPAQCTSCRLNAEVPVCRVDCGVSAPTCNNKITCPAGFHCEILCSEQNSCRDGIDCAAGASCDITCSGQSACEDVTCGPGACDIDCSGDQACRDVTCESSCACNLDCGVLADCFPLTCKPSCTDGLGGCTTFGAGCDTCP